VPYKARQWRQKIEAASGASSSIAFAAACGTVTFAPVFFSFFFPAFFFFWALHISPMMVCCTEEA
jgi:hypothetical protein